MKIVYNNEMGEYNLTCLRESITSSPYDIHKQSGWYKLCNYLKDLLPFVMIIMVLSDLPKLEYREVIILLVSESIAGILLGISLIVVRKHKLMVQMANLRIEYKFNVIKDMLDMKMVGREAIDEADDRVEFIYKGEDGCLYHRRYKMEKQQIDSGEEYIDLEEMKIYYINKDAVLREV